MCPPPPSLSDPVDPLVGCEIGPYRVEARVGAGHAGVVYRAVDLRLDRTVALKLLAPALSADVHERLLREAAAVAALDHPHVAPVYDAGTTADGRFFFATPLYDGETLEDRIARGPLGAEEAVALAVQIASGLGALHRAGLVHGDVRPANVIVVDTGGVPCAKVLDASLARIDSLVRTDLGPSVGPTGYQSPEQLRDESDDARSDVWGLGVVVYEMLSGRRPFAVAGNAAFDEDPLPLENLPARLEDAVMRCLAKDPADRFASMDALAEALEGSAESVPSPRTPAPFARAAGRPASWGWIVALVGGAVVALVALLAAPRARSADGPRLVMLPFHTDGADAEALAAGLVETATAKLATLSPLRERVRVIPVSEVTPGLTPSEAFKTLGATLIVEGTLTTEGNTARLTLSLVEMGPDGATQGDSRQIDDTSGSAFALQDAVALEIADLLRITIGEAERDALAAGGTDDPKANELYLRARGMLLNQQSVGDLDRARALFKEALGLDPAFAVAYAGLAEAEWQTYRRTDDTAWAERAVASGRRALDLDASLPEVHVAMAVILQGRGELADALTSIDRAVALDDRSADAVRRRGQILRDLGRADEAERAFQRAVALAPDHWRTYNSLGVFYLDAGRPDNAEAQFRLGLARAPANLTLLGNLGVAAWLRGDFEGAARASADVLRLDPANADASFNLSVNRLYLGDAAGAVAAAEQAVALQPDGAEARHALASALWWAPGGRPRARAELTTVLRLGREHLAVGRDVATLTTLAEAFALTGQRDSALAYLGEAESVLPPTDVDVQDAFVVGAAYELAGDRARALSWLGQALRRGYGAAQIQHSPWLRALRSDSLAASLLTSPPAP